MGLDQEDREGLEGGREGREGGEGEEKEKEGEMGEEKGEEGEMGEGSCMVGGRAVGHTDRSCRSAKLEWIHR